MPIRKSQHEFIEQARKIHLNKYQYGKSLYKNSTTKIVVGCEIHGEFLITPHNHLKGVGCADCGKLISSKTRLSNLDESIQICSKIYNNKYSYELISDYKKGSEKVPVICPLHGVFKVTFQSHKAGRSCSRCAKHGFNRDKLGSFYVLKSGGLIKVGITNRPIKTRLAAINKSSKENFKIIYVVENQSGEIVQGMERSSLSWLREKYKNPERVFDGYTECFLNVNVDELISFIKIIDQTTKGI